VNSFAQANQTGSQNGQTGTLALQVASGTYARRLVANAGIHSAECATGEARELAWR
jgi:hypothetical protein